MTESRSAFLAYWRRLSLRERVLAALTAMTAVSALIYVFPYTMEERAVKLLKTNIAASEKEILGLSLQVEEL
jgi:hypothetical protein